jgi:rhodanese-related sulfurtransferase
MNTITRINRQELKTKLDRGDKVKLVMALNDWAYSAKHIPGSLHFNTIPEALTKLKQDDDIVLYCTGTSCMASVWTYHFLRQKGYRRVRHYAGGLADWEKAGYPVEGKMVNGH